jgi:hypothetical protein
MREGEGERRREDTFCMLDFVCLWWRRSEGLLGIDVFWEFWEILKTWIEFVARNRSRCCCFLLILFQFSISRLYEPVEAKVSPIIVILYGFC